MPQFDTNDLHLMALDDETGINDIYHLSELLEDVLEMDVRGTLTREQIPNLQFDLRCFGDDLAGIVLDTRHTLMALDPSNCPQVLPALACPIALLGIPSQSRILLIIAGQLRQLGLRCIVASTHIDAMRWIQSCLPKNTPQPSRQLCYSV